MTDSSHRKTGRRVPRFINGDLTQYPLDNMSFLNARQLKVQTLETVREVPVINPKQVQHGRMQITHMNGILQCMVT